MKQPHLRYTEVLCEKLKFVKQSRKGKELANLIEEIDSTNQKIHSVGDVIKEN